jgi:hypothetical protein
MLLFVDSAANIAKPQKKKKVTLQHSRIALRRATAG